MFPALKIMHRDQIENLRVEVEKTFGKKILTAADCLMLADDILQKTKMRLSFNTVRRFFRLMSSSASPSFNTIQTFLKYCGFHSEDSFEEFIKKQHAALADTDYMLLNYLVEVFKEVKVKTGEDRTFLQFVSFTIRFVSKYPKLVDEFQMRIARLENGRQFYFQKCVYIDKINSFYGKGINYYLREDGSDAAQILGHSLLSIRAWLNNDRERVIRHFHRASQFEITPEDDPVISGFYFSAQLLCACTDGSDRNKALVSARNHYIQMRVQRESVESLSDFEIIYCDALILAAQYSEAMVYIETALFKTRNLNYIGSSDNLLIDMRLYQAVALSQLKQIDNAKAILRYLNPMHFSFLRKNYLTIIYLNVLRSLYKSKRSDEIQLDFLIESTGFTALRDIFNRIADPI